MNELPRGWASASVSEVIENFQPGFASGEKNVAGGVPHLRMNNIGLDGELVLALMRTVPEKLAKPRHDLSPGDVLVCTTNSGALVGKCAYFDLPGRYAFSNHLTRLRPKHEIVDGGFLRWNLWLHWKRGVFDDKCKHWVNQSTLPKDVLLEDEIVVPPLPEQRRIVAKLETLLGKVDASQQRLAKIPVLLKRFRQSVLAAACSGRLTVDWREKNEGGSYESTTIEAIAEYVGGFAYKSPTFLETGQHQVIRIGNVRPFSLNLNASPVFIPDDIATDTERFNLKTDDIVISMTGTKYKRDYGCAGIVCETDGSLFINQRVARVRCGESVLPKFLLFWLQTDLFRDFFFSGETGNVNQGNVGAGGIRNAPIELPPSPSNRKSCGEWRDCLRWPTSLRSAWPRRARKWRSSRPHSSPKPSAANSCRKTRTTNRRRFCWSESRERADWPGSLKAPSRLESVPANLHRDPQKFSRARNEGCT